MRLKSFHGSTINEAMRLVRDALGDDAIIVATRDDESGGFRVTAAIDEVTTSTKEAAAELSASVIAANSESDGSEVIEVIAEALMRHQVPGTLAERLLTAATQFANEEPIMALAAAFDTHLQFSTLPEDKIKKPMIFIGPPGAGKTLCTAKLATKTTMEKNPVAVISTDTERAGGMEQLAAFTRLLKIGMIEIEDEHALKEAVAMQPSNSTVLIDTPGRNIFNETERKQLHQLITAANGDTILVMPADMDSSEAIDMTKEYAAIGASRIMMTRLDITRRMGGLIRTAFESKLPLINFSASPKVTESPKPMNPITLARLVLNQEQNRILK